MRREDFDTYEDYEAERLHREWLEELRIEAEIDRLERWGHYNPRTDWDGPPDINGVQWPYTLDDYLEATGKEEME